MIKTDSKNLIINEINEKSAMKKNVIIAIDGRCASGKTTFSEFLKNVYGQKCSVIHTDHFFLPLNLRTVERLSEPGGNIDYDRFHKEVIDRLNKNKTFTYNIFNCKSMSLSGKVTIPGTGPVTVVEGSYSLHPKFGDYADIKIFMDVSDDIQTKRILQRNGKEAYDKFINQWIPMENLYFSKMKIREKCDFILAPEL